MEVMGAAGDSDDDAKESVSRSDHHHGSIVQSSSIVSIPKWIVIQVTHIPTVGLV